jgi:phosphoribosylformylglycinamidine cyclo-ligase
MPPLTPDHRPDLYKEAGVDVEKGDELVDWLVSTEAAAKNNKFGAKVSGIGGFAALFRPDFRGLKDPLLISSTDGVGTKVLLGTELNSLEGLGIDLVAMCVNDLYTLGGRPLFFLDYYATGKLDAAQFKDVLTGIRRACAQSGALLMGGETAEMPGLYGEGHFDLAGFVVGVVDGESMLGPHRVKVGDVLYALPSSGFHSNGYSLLRKWYEKSKRLLTTEDLDQLMMPTRVYHEIPDLLEATGSHVFHALANITGGGISGNLPRVMPKDVVCRIDPSTLPTSPWMTSFIERHGTTPLAVEGVFNLGCGMIAAVDTAGSQGFESAAKSLGLEVVSIGVVASGSGEPTVVFESLRK